MTRTNVPVEMLACCGPDGELRPLRFRFEAPDHLLHTVSITELVDSRRVEYVGLEAFVYLCRATMDGAEKLFELKYTVRTHRWVLFREVY
jgi:hypothetical protein